MKQSSEWPTREAGLRRTLAGPSVAGCAHRRPSLVPNLLDTRDTLPAQSSGACSPRLPRRPFESSVALFFLFFLIICFSVTGCSHEWRKKFIRKRQKEVQPPQAILTLQPDYKAMVPAADRYREHFAFWKSWHGELLSSLGQIQKRDVRYLNGVIGELRTMQALLTGQPAQRMREILVELQEMEDKWSSAPSTWSIPISHRTTLERLQREIDKAFYYSRVKDSLAKDAKQ